MLNEETKTYTAINYVKTRQGTDPDSALFPPEYLAKLNPTELPAHDLILTKNSIIMLIKNFNIKGLWKRPRLIIVSMQNNVLECKILTGDKAGETVYIPQITISCVKK